MNTLNRDESPEGQDSNRDQSHEDRPAPLETSFPAREEAKLKQTTNYVLENINEQPICYEVDLQIAPSSTTQDWRSNLQNRIEPFQNIARKLDVEGRNLTAEASSYSTDEKLVAIALIELKGAVKGYLRTMQAVLEVPDKKPLESSEKWYSKYRDASRGCQEHALKLESARDTFLVASAGLPE